MKRFFTYSARYGHGIEVGLRYLFVILFVYAGMSKLLDFETFQVQLAQSPLLSAYAGFVAWAVPLSEFLIAILLLIDRTPVWGLSGFFFFMVMFTTYIIIILNFADFIPCSCGGVLEKMSWGQHLVFNIAFVLVSGVLLYFQFPGNWRRRVLILGSQIVLGVGVVSVLFAFSEKKMHRNNAFVRRYPHHPVFPVDSLDLKFNSYYFAGSSQHHFYLGNYTAPKHLIAFQKTLNDTVHFQVKVNTESTIYRYPRLEVFDGAFFFYDGTVPIIHFGSADNFVEQKIFYPRTYFDIAKPSSTSNLVIRAVNDTTGNNILGRITLDRVPEIQIFSTLLTGELDGYFDRDGQLLFNSQLRQIIYTYFYKNEILIISSDFNTSRLFRTIDTIQHPQIDVQELKESGTKKLGDKSVRVHGYSATYGNHLIVNSDRLGRHEPKELINKALIFDVYNIRKGTYEFSFNLYHTGQLYSFWFNNRDLYVLIDDGLFHYEFKNGFLE